MKLLWLRRAERSLEAIAELIATENPDAAYALIQKIRRAARGLLKNPSLGRAGRVLGTRELIIPGTPYLLPYRVQGEAVQILHVFHSSRQWPFKF